MNVILREMPPVWDAAFRPWFYSRWGKENCIIGARAKKAEYEPFEQNLSIKAAWGGREAYFLDGRRVVVSDDTYLILNAARTYSSVICSQTPITSFSIFFRPDIVDDVFHTIGKSQESLLANPQADRAQFEFSEHVRSHDKKISPILKFVLAQVGTGYADEGWYEEQLSFLLARMCKLQSEDVHKAETIPAIKPSTRRELYRRVGLAANFIDARFAEQITLDQIAEASLLSRFHCLRVFRSVYGMTPIAYLKERRLQTACRLLRSGKYTVGEVAERTGFRSRVTLFRQMRRSRGISPRRAKSTAEE